MQQLSSITKTLILTGFSALSLFAIAPAQAASFRGLGDYIVHDPFLWGGSRDYYNIRANEVSADGSVVVGSIERDYYIENETVAFRWTQADGINIIATGNSGSPYRPPFSSAYRVSDDGSVVIGTSWNEGYRYGTGYSSSFQWTQNLGLTENFPVAYPNDMSANGSVFVESVPGQNYYDPFPRPPFPPYDPYKAYRWTQETGRVPLGNLGNNSLDTLASAVSADGSVIVGLSGNANGHEEAFRWTQETGMMGLGFLTNDIDINANGNSKANEVSADGSVVIGSSRGAYGGDKAFRWTQETGMMDLGSLDPNVASSTAKDVSADGSIVVGYSYNVNSNKEAFRWTQETGMVSLKETLIGKGLDVSGWSLTSANAISADGFTIVGNGINPSGQSEAWVANLSPEPVPEPLTILGSIAAIAFAAGFERKFGKNKSDEKDPDA
ncbi:MAG: PEP-CTERM sorting domain-containing protein [Snowella sp.]